MRILVPNLGSTSLKYQLIEFPSERALAKGRLERIGRPNGDAASYREAVENALASGEAPDAIGFKAVHAGPRYRGSFPVDDDLLAALREYEPVAPLHNGIYLSGIETFRELRPDLPLVAVLETGFHRTIPGTCRDLWGAARLARGARDSALRVPRRVTPLHQRPERRNSWAGTPPSCASSRATWGEARRSARSRAASRSM